MIPLRKFLGPFLGTFLTAALVLAAGSATADEPNARPANRLARESSPYLLQHARNPVDWHPWGPEAFEKARRENKPIFLSVGYSSCHWCHVMERLVFENRDIAAVMNEHFVCIKVDREERPEVDEVYMTALQVYFQAIRSSQGGGWPLSMFLTPDGKPFAGGTYFPPEDAEGQTGFKTVLEKIRTIWQTSPKNLESNAEVIARETKRLLAEPRVVATPLDRGLAAHVAASILETADPEWGGFAFEASRPNVAKFPSPTRLIFLEERLAAKADDAAARALDLTFTKMALGGLRDHLGGGFHRYSVDRRWLVPHFEKMLYDQALLADAYLAALRRNDAPLYREVVRDTCDLVLRELTGPQGGFYSAIDADTDGREGAYYVWSRAEVQDVLGSNAPRFLDIYGVEEEPDFEAGNVLRLTRPLSEQAASYALSEAEFGQALAADRHKLLAARNLRPRPFVDDKVIAGWNGLMIGALAKAGRALGEKRYVEAAEKAASFVLAELVNDEGRLARTWRLDQTKGEGCLEDYAYLTAGLLDLYEVTEKPTWRNAADRLMTQQMQRFHEAEHGGFYFTPHDQTDVFARIIAAGDNVLPAPNAVALRNILRRSRLETPARPVPPVVAQGLKRFAGELQRSPLSTAALAMILDEYLAVAEAPPKEAATPSAERPPVKHADGKGDEPTEIRPISDEAGVANPEKLTARVYLPVDKLPAGRAIPFAVILNVKPGWHIYANPAGPKTLPPTKITVNSRAGVKLRPIQYPPGRTEKTEIYPEPVSTYEGRFAIRGVLEIPADAAGTTDELEVKIKAQCCSDDTCLPPKTITLKASIDVVRPDEPITPLNQKLFTPP